ncbi:family 1 glycosylhydrolase [Sulfurisphaera ohwakuensis]|uniref:family 1 glycosylhydrolase n=1 Tax=Sulfurisphaera ohwakuensis TaxID=69656 RepID=UPI0036F3B2BA
MKDNFSEYVDLWCTFNEPNIMILFVYLSGIFPPGITSRRAYENAWRNVLTAHQEVYNLFHGEKVGIILIFHIFRVTREQNMSFSQL